MKRFAVLLAAALPALAGCFHRPSPADAERTWERSLRSTLPPGWRVLVVTGNPDKNKFVCWFEAPGPDGRTRRVEVRVSPRPADPDERDWTVLVHPPADPAPAASVSFAVGKDGAGPLEPAAGADPAAVEAARPLAEEAVRQVRGLGLF